MIKILVLARNTGLNILIEWIYLQRKRLIYGFEIEYRWKKCRTLSPNYKRWTAKVVILLCRLTKFWG